jgi:hypothetical protein
MPFARTYGLFEVMAALRESDGRPSPFNGQPGHALALHVHARGLQISDRLRPVGEDLPGAYQGMTSPSGRPLGNSGTAPITEQGRGFVMGSSTVNGPSNGQDVKSTWENYELQKKIGSITDRVNNGLASTNPRLVANATALAAQPLPTTVAAITVNTINRTYVKRYLGCEMAGAFADAQQAAFVAVGVLNSSAGLLALQKLDGAEKRVTIETPVSPVIGGNPVLLYVSCRDLTGGDQPHLVTIASACMVVDRMPDGSLHIHTFYPVP